LAFHSGQAFALSLGGFEELGVVADFDEGILRGGSREAVVANSLKASVHFVFLSPTVAFMERKNSCT
jgi:hypothetical protein